MSCVPEHDICRARGDTHAEVFQLKVNGVAADITGDTLLLTVDPSDAPPDASNNLFQLTATLVTPASGIFSFAPSALQADQEPAEYFYDIQWDNGAEKRTILRGKFTFVQDITKT